MTKTVLVVEDDPANLSLMEAVLVSNGYTVVSSKDGSDTLDLARTHKPGLVLMDIQLPKIDGKDRIRQLKADPDLAHIPVIAVTTQVMKGDEQAIRASGCDEYISKPFNIPALMDAVDSMHL